MASIQNFFVRVFFKRVVKRKRGLGSGTSVEKSRTSLAKLTKMVKMPKGVSYEAVVCDGVPAEWAVPKNLKNPGVVLFMHGGAYVAGSIATHRALVGRIARASKTKCLSIEYRLAPENPFPHGLDDAITAYHWLLKQGFDHKKIVICGDSAGGGLAAATLLRLKDEKAPQPAAGVFMSPWMDLEGTGESAIRLANEDLMLTHKAGAIYARHYVPNGDLRHPYASPLYADHAGLPPIYIQVSSSEILLDDTLRFEKKAKEVGVDIQVESWKKMMHVWQAFGSLLPEAMEAIKKMGAYIEKKTK